MNEAQEKLKNNLFIEFLKHLRDLIDKPPYLMSYFTSSFLLIISLLRQEKYFGLFFILLIYSTIGVVWRHATKDLRGRLKEKYPERFNGINLWLTGLYQIINIGLIIYLVKLLLIFWKNNL